MNKYTLGTIVGSALLGFAKNSGSKIKLIVQPKMMVRDSIYIEIYQYEDDYSYDQYVEEVEEAIHRILSKYDFISNINFSVNTTEDEHDEYTYYYLDTNITYDRDDTPETKPVGEDIKNEIVDYIDRHRGLAYNEIEHYTSNNSFSKPTLYNFDTGEEYKPSKGKSNLRAR